MTTAADVHALLARSALAQGEADELASRALAAAQRGDAPKAWVLEQRAGRLLAEARALALEAQRMLERQAEAARVVREACAICAAAVGRG